MVHSTAKRLAREGKSTRGRGRGGKRGSSSRGGSKGGGGRPLKEVVWDDDARREYLTGFSKRKKEKQAAAQAKALEKEKVEKLELRQQLRDARKEQAATNVAMAKEYYGGTEGELQPGTSVLEPAEPEEQEYENEEMTSRVVIEDFNMNDDDDEDGRQAEEEEGEEDETMMQDEEDEDDDDDPNANIFAILAPKPKNAPTPSTSTSTLKEPKRETRPISTSRSSSSRSKLPDARSILNEDAPSSTNEFIEEPEEGADAAKKVPKRFTYESKAARRAESANQKKRRLEKVEFTKSGRGGKSGRGAKGGRGSKAARGGKSRR